jgi:hypothetical protein
MSSSLHITRAKRIDILALDAVMCDRNVMQETAQLVQVKMRRQQIAAEIGHGVVLCLAGVITIGLDHAYILALRAFAHGGPGGNTKT